MFGAGKAGRVGALAVAGGPRRQRYGACRDTMPAVSSVVLWLAGAAVVALIMFGVAAALTGRAEPPGPAPRDAWAPRLPADRPVTAGEVRRLRFEMAFRGYRMADVDAVLDRLADELAAREQDRAEWVDELAAREKQLTEREEQLAEHRAELAALRARVGDQP